MDLRIFPKKNENTPNKIDINNNVYSENIDKKIDIDPNTGNKIVKIKIKKKMKVKKNLQNGPFLEERAQRPNVFSGAQRTEVDDNSKNKIELIYPNKNKTVIINSINDRYSLNYNVENNDLELNAVSYEEALVKDKRTFCQYYTGLLKYNNLLLFSFFPNNDYNSRIEKVLLYFFFFALDLTINALFFTESTLHKIYEDKGEFNFIYQLPQILYATIITVFIFYLLRFFFLTEDNIENIKKEKKKNLPDFYDKILILGKKLKIKFILFFVFSFIFLGFFWFYISCFCGVYKKTKIHLLKNTLLSFSFAQVYTFITCLLPAIFRKFSLKDKKNDKAYSYRISQFLENI